MSAKTSRAHRVGGPARDRDQCRDAGKDREQVGQERDAGRDSETLSSDTSCFVRNRMSRQPARGMSEGLVARRPHRTGIRLRSCLRRVAAASSASVLCGAVSCWGLARGLRSTSCCAPFCAMRRRVANVVPRPGRDAAKRRGGRGGRARYIPQSAGEDPLCAARNEQMFRFAHAASFDSLTRRGRRGADEG